MRFITGFGKGITIGTLWKQGWNEIPELMIAGIGTILGVGFGVYGMKKYIDNDSYHRRYRGRYVVYRPDNPNVPHIKHGPGKYIKPEN